MQRMIPGKTKVHIELFRGVTIGDVIVAGVAAAMLVFVILSNLPGKLFFCIGIVGLAAVLLVRLDEQPNYLYLLHILSYLGYRRSFAKLYRDQELLGESAKQAAFDGLFDGEAEGKDDKKKKKRPKKTRTAAPVAALSDKERTRRRKEEDRLLKSSKTPQEEKDAILERRRADSEDAMRRMAEAKEAKANRDPMEEILPFTGIRDGFIEYLNQEYYGAVLEIDPVEFRFFSESRRANSIENCLGRILRSVHAGYSANIVKLERPILYDHYLDREYDKLDALSRSYENGVFSEEELKARVEIEYDRINELRRYCDTEKIITPFYYLVLFESDKRQLESQIREAQQLLETGELTVRRLDDRELAVFLKYSNQIDFDERDVEKVQPEDLHLWAQPDTVDIKVRRVEVNHIVTHNFRVVNYPTMVGDAYLAGLMSIPGTKVVVKAQPMDRSKAIRNIDRSLQELRGQWSATGVDSRRMEIEEHIETLQELLSTLQNDVEALLECNIYVTAYDIVATRANYRIVQPPLSELPTINDMKKNIRRSWQESGFRLNNMEFDQVQAFIGSQVSALDPMVKESRGISSNTIAACFPWIYAHISDEGGVKLGTSDGVPVFIDFFRRDNERVNSNMVIVGKSGSGKSYATKSLLANLAAEDAKIFILDPENEYTELAANLHGQIINVGNAQYGRLNPFHIITALDDDEAGDNGPSGSYATHLQFLEEFFKQIMPDCEKDAMEYLNTLVDHMYLTHNITGDTDLSRLRPEDYPIFDDLYDEVLQEFQSSDNPFTRDLLRTLMNYIAKFSTGGRNANIWNGPSSVTTDENFTVFNFQSMLANRNSTIANAQMLLVLKYIDNEIIKNRDYNTRYRANRKIVVVIDEAHVFIDSKFPIALDFMFQLAKRIRKYNGMQIVITQNIKDFVGSEELARKSTAIINACQYSLIFSLAPNDMQDLVTLYEKAGGINENEQEQIVQAPRGQAFAVMGPTSRSSFRVETAAGVAEMFQQRDYQSRYFTGPQGAENWEDFVAESRPAHQQAMAARRQQAQTLPEMEDISSEGKVTLHVYEEEEYQALQEQPREEAVTLTVQEEPEQEARKDVVSDARQLSFGDLLGERDAASINVLDKIATALGRMADAAERGEVPLPVGAAAVSVEEPAQEPPETAPAGESEEERSQRLAMEEEIRQLRAQIEEMMAPAPEPEPEAAPAQPEPEPETEETLADDDYAPEESGDLEEMFDPFRDLEDLPDADSTLLAFDEEEPEQEDEDEDEEEEEDEETEEDEDEEDDDFMKSFMEFAYKLQEMTVFERMRANDTKVTEITLEELEKEIQAQQERRRRGEDRT